jgi:hypothetical protein
VFDHYGPVKEGSVGLRVRGVLISMAKGKAVDYSLHPLQARGLMLRIQFENLVIHARELYIPDEYVLYHRAPYLSGHLYDHLIVFVAY